MEGRVTSADAAAAVTPESAEVDVRAHLDALPPKGAVMDDNEQWLRRLFLLMKPWWPDKGGRDALHQVLSARYRIAHLGQLRAAGLRELVEHTHKAATEKLDAA
jgi:hypothetical protein